MHQVEESHQSQLNDAPNRNDDPEKGQFRSTDFHFVLKCLLPYKRDELINPLQKKTIWLRYICRKTSLERQVNVLGMSLHVELLVPTIVIFENGRFFFAFHRSGVVRHVENILHNNVID